MVKFLIHNNWNIKQRNEMSRLMCKALAWGECYAEGEVPLIYKLKFKGYIVIDIELKCIPK